MTYHRICNWMINTTGVTSGAGTAYPSRPVFSGVRVTRCLVLYVFFVDRCLSFWIFFSFGHCVEQYDRDDFLNALLLMYSKNKLVEFLSSQNLTKITDSSDGKKNG